MSRMDRIIARKMEAPRKARVKEEVTQYAGYRFVTVTTYAPQHKTGSKWWNSRFADLVELRNNGRTRDKKPEKAPAPVLAQTDLPRPEGMSRQVYRALCRQARKLAARA